MQVAIHNYHADLVDAFRVYIERRLRFALSRFAGHVGPVAVRICKNGPSESSCRISVDVPRFRRIAVEEIDSDLFAAVDRATGRIGRVFGRELQRGQEARLGRESIRLIA